MNQNLDFETVLKIIYSFNSSVATYSLRIYAESKGMLTICKWPKDLIVLNLVKSGRIINKMAKVLITLIS